MRPTVELTAWTEGVLGDGVAERFLSAFARDGAAVDWVEGRPTVADDVDRDGVRFVECSHTFAAPGPWVTPAFERRLLAEVRCLVGWLARMSGDLGMVFVIQHDNRLLGRVQHGTVEPSVSEDLLDIWQRDLDRLDRPPR